MSTKIDLPFPLFLKPVAEGSGKGVDRELEGRRMRGDCDALPPNLLAKFPPAGAGRDVPAGPRIHRRHHRHGRRRARAGRQRDRADRPTASATAMAIENKEDWEDKVVIDLADEAEAQGGGRCGARGVARAALPRRRAHRHPQRCAAASRNFIEVNPLAGLRPEYSDLCFIARFKGIVVSATDRQDHGLRSSSAIPNLRAPTVDDARAGPAFRCAAGRAAGRAGHAHHRARHRAMRCVGAGMRRNLRRSHPIPLR